MRESVTELRLTACKCCMVCRPKMGIKKRDRDNRSVKGSKLSAVREKDSPIRYIGWMKMS